MRFCHLRAPGLPWASASWGLWLSLGSPVPLFGLLPTWNFYASLGLCLPGFCLSLSGLRSSLSFHRHVASGPPLDNLCHSLILDLLEASDSPWGVCAPLWASPAHIWASAALWPLGLLGRLNAHPCASSRQFLISIRQFKCANCNWCKPIPFRFANLNSPFPT